MYRTRELLRAAVSLLSPNRCPFCDTVIGAFGYMHEECLARLAGITDGIKPPEYVGELFACCLYEGSARDAVLRLKEGRYIYSAQAFAPLMLEVMGGAAKRADIVTAVPSGLASRLKRGYAPAAAIAKELARRCGVRYVPTLRTDKSFEQKRLNARERAENVRNAFEVVDSGAIQGRNILLVDDVCTTGSTLSACARVLRENGAAEVNAVVFALTPPNR